MPKALNEAIVTELTARFRDVDSAVFLNYQTLDATTSAGLRAELRARQVRMTVVKNSSFARAMERLGRARGRWDLRGPIAVLSTDQEGGGFQAAKVLRELRRKFPKLVVAGGFADQDLADADQVRRVWPELPTREDLIAQVAGAICGMGGSVLAQLLGPAWAVASQLEKRIEQLEEHSQEAEDGSQK